MRKDIDMDIKEYMNDTFPGVILKPSIYFQWENHIHFDFGKGIFPYECGTATCNNKYFSQIYKYNTLLFQDIFSAKDMMFLVINVYHFKKERLRKQKKLRLYSRFLKKKELKFRLRQETFPYFFDDEDAELYCTYQFLLQCLAEDIKYIPLIKAMNHEDFPNLYPRLGGRADISYPDVFLINATKDIIMFIYDDRGCEVIAKNKESIRHLYNKYEKWIPDYELDHIATLFK